MKSALLVISALVLALGMHADLFANQPASAPGISSMSGMDSQRDIVLAVTNSMDPPSMHAGSSLLSYAPAANYSVGQRAIAVVDEIKQDFRLRAISGWPIKTLSLYCVVMEPPADISRDALLKALAKDARVQLVEPLQDYALYSEPKAPHAYNDPYVDLQRGFVEIDAALAHNLSQGDGVNVAVIDTGVDLAHPDLQGRIRDALNFVDQDSVAFSQDAHGTEIAGVIAATGDNRLGIVGIAPKAVLSVYKACWYALESDAGAHCNSFTLAKALAALLDKDTRVVNLSLGGPPSSLLNKLLVQLMDQGRIVVAAMPPDTSLNGFPDNVSGVIVVRARLLSIAPSNILSAPGKDILTTEANGGYDFTSGSSLAAAHVSGIVALLLSLDPKLNAHEVQTLLLKNSKISHGMLQVNAASTIAAIRSQQNLLP